MTHGPVGSPVTFTELQVHLQLSQNCRLTYDFHRTAGPQRKPKIYSDELLQYSSHTGCPVIGAILPQLQTSGHLSRASHSSYSLKPKSSSQPAWPAGNTLTSPSCEQTRNKTLIKHLKSWWLSRCSWWSADRRALDSVSVCLSLPVVVYGHKGLVILPPPPPPPPPQLLSLP